MRSQLRQLQILLAAAMTMLTAGTNLYSQTEASQTSEVKNSFFKGSKSLQFRITDNFNLASFQGGTLSLKRHKSDKKALRFGLSLSGSVGDQNESSTNQTLKIESDQNGQFIAMNAHYLTYPSPDRAVNLFWGFGPTVSYSRSSVTMRGTDSNGFDSLRKTKNTSWSAGTSGVVGVEWFASRRIGVLAEYASSLNYASSSQKDTTEIRTASGVNVNSVETKRNTKGLGFSAESVRFGLSVYF